jgi:hypothetical protein
MRSAAPMGSKGMGGLRINMMDLSEEVDGKDVIGGEHGGNPPR